MSYAIVYSSPTGNTAMLAQAIREGMASGVPNLIEVYMENAPV